MLPLPPELSPHSFRSAVITDLLSECVPLEAVQRLASGIVTLSALISIW